MDAELVREHYSKPIVRQEIIRFSRGRWLAATSGTTWIRYVGRKPLTINSLDLPDFMLRRGCRSLYATTSIYRRLRTREDPFSEDNVVAVTPYLDIDNRIEDWKATIFMALEVVRELERLGIERSVYVLWSGKGAHVRVHERAISHELRGLDSAWALAEYVKLKVEDKLIEARNRYGAKDLRVENQLKPRSLFTVPLTIHRKIDRIAICMRPEKLDEFELSWSEPGAFIHDASWSEYEEGEADNAVLEALSKVGGYPLHRYSNKRKEPTVEEMIRRWLDSKG